MIKVQFDYDFVKKFSPSQSNLLILQWTDYKIYTINLLYYYFYYQYSYSPFETNTWSNHPDSLRKTDAENPSGCQKRKADKHDVDGATCLLKCSKNGLSDARSPT